MSLIEKLLSEAKDARSEAEEYQVPVTKDSWIFLLEKAAAEIVRLQKEMEDYRKIIHAIEESESE